MYVARLGSIDSSFNFKAFTSRRQSLSSFEAGQSQVIDERLEESMLSDVASAYGARTATQSIGEGRASFCGSILGPTTEAQAAACSRIWISSRVLKKSFCEAVGV
jgi:hypothetical protein